MDTLSLQAADRLPTTSSPYITTLVCRDGALHVICLNHGNLQPVCHVAETVTALQDGDRVLCLFDDTLGVVVTDRIVPLADSHPGTDLVTELDNGQLLFDAPKGLLLRSGDAQIELRPDGTLMLDGREIHAIADGINRLLGARIELN
ncbi:MAG: hypothetical protein R3292_02490 [Alcanivorax sp.]|nr:hypothetical protein [Alcanivorax sp.]